MIQIDDAGSGSLIGGTVVGIIRVETNEYYYDVIPVKCFTSPYFEGKEYTKYASKIINKGLKELNIPKDEIIEICQGYIFEDAREMLRSKGYDINPCKIDEPLQSMVENTFVDYAVHLGIPRNYLQYTKYPFHFHRIFKWVLADFNRRKKICKTAWKSWNQYSSVTVERYTDSLLKSNYKCLKCGKDIVAPCKIRVLKFTTNREHLIYIHINCPSSQ